MQLSTLSNHTHSIIRLTNDTVALVHHEKV